jgi:hypothetical protein
MAHNQGEPHTKYFYREADNLRVGYEYVLRGSHKGIVGSLLMRDGRRINKLNTTVRIDDVSQLTVRFKDGTTKTVAPNVAPRARYAPGTYRSDLQIVPLPGNKGIWLRNR